MDLGRWLRLTWDRAAAVGLISAAIVALVLGWVGVSGAEYPALQVPYVVSGGIAGVFILILGALCWVSADMRDEWTELRRIELALHRLADSGLVDVGVLLAVDEPSSSAEASPPATTQPAVLQSARRARHED